jgi:hypothetical protein
VGRITGTVIVKANVTQNGTTVPQTMYLDGAQLTTGDQTEGGEEPVRYGEEPKGLSKRIEPAAGGGERKTGSPNS